jgi:16S rRNA (cytidine1402-2'-O)-methyltransferase
MRRGKHAPHRRPDARPAAVRAPGLREQAPTRLGGALGSNNEDLDENSLSDAKLDEARPRFDGGDVPGEPQDPAEDAPEDAQGDQQGDPQGDAQEDAEATAEAELRALLEAPPAAPSLEEPVPGVLYLVPTPLGHLGDLSPRARKVLLGVDLLLCEDTRVSRRLLSHIDAHPKLLSCHSHNERGRAQQAVALLQAGRRLALVSDAGTPVVSDPGESVVDAVLAAGLPVCALPGPCAATTALSASGLPAARFLFVGFLPRSKTERAAALAALRAEPATLLLYESPHRLVEVAAALAEGLGADRRCCFSQNLSKRTERHLRGTLAEASAALAAAHAVQPTAGEWTVVVEGAPAGAAPPPTVEGARVSALIAGLQGAGLGARAARDLVAAAFGLSKKDAYDAILAVYNQEPG